MASVSRRTVLKGAAALAAATAFPRRASANERIRVGIIGCRVRGPQVAASMIRSGQFDVPVICDCDDAMVEKARADAKDVFAEKPPRAEKDFRRLLEDPDIDAVVVATPDHWHAMMTILALDAGKYVYLEKPASFNIGDGKAMLAAHARRPELAVQVGTQQRSGRHFADAKAFIQAGGLGKVAFCRASHVSERHVVPVVPDSEPPASLDYELWCGPAPIHPYNEELLHYNWHFRYDYGTGDMGNWGAHWLDVLRWLLDLDLPVSVSGYGGQYVVKDAKEFPDTQTVMYHFPELTMLWELRHWSRFMPGGGRGNCCEIDGEKGSLVVDRRGWRFYPRDEDASGEEHPGSEMEVAHALSFAKAIRGEGAPSAPLVEGHKSAILCHLGNITARLNRSVAFDPARETIAGDPEAEAMMDRGYRAPWVRGA